jgi:hypothetical protein
MRIANAARRRGRGRHSAVKAAIWAMVGTANLNSIDAKRVLDIVKPLLP